MERRKGISTDQSISSTITFEEKKIMAGDDGHTDDHLKGEMLSNPSGSHQIDRAKALQLTLGPGNEVNNLK